MQPVTNLKTLDGLIARLDGNGIGTDSPGPYGLLLEHIRAARRDLLGSMRAEYRSSLQFAQESLACIPVNTDRAEAGKILQSLIDSEARPKGLRV